VLPKNKVTQCIVHIPAYICYLWKQYILCE